jgi:hypothetical protein
MVSRRFITAQQALEKSPEPEELQEMLDKGAAKPPAHGGMSQASGPAARPKAGSYTPGNKRGA